METIQSLEEIAANILEFDRYRESSVSHERDFFAERLRLGKIFGHMIVRGHSIFGPSRFIGYKKNTMAKHVAFEWKNGGVTTQRITTILGRDHRFNDRVEQAYRDLCDEVGVKPAFKNRTYWVIPSIAGATFHRRTSGASGFPDEVGKFFEGRTKKVRVNTYERDQKARMKCISHYGCACQVCGMKFEEVYGKIGVGFIHVHHVNPLSMHSGERNVDPIKDLTPVCPNCHAMIHMSDPPFSVEELRGLLKGLPMEKPTPHRKSTR